MFQKAHVYGLMLDPIKEMPILVLKDDADGRVLPIWIGHYEANAIAMHLEGIHVPRPMTHDLLCALLEKTGGTLERVLIKDLQDHTYFAEIVVNTGSSVVELDARPSDAIAMAVRMDAPIFVKNDLYERADLVNEADELEHESIHQWLEKLGPEDLGEYEM